MEQILSVRSVAGEDARFFVTGRTLFCSVCKYSYQPRPEGQPKHSAGDKCSKEGCAGTMQPHDYLVDLTLYDGIGKCGCHRWQFYLQPLVSKLSQAERLLVRESNEYVCPHIQAALRFFAMEKIDNLNRLERRNRSRHGHADREASGE